MKNPDPEETTRLLWPVPDAGKYLSFGGPQQWIERENEETGRNFRFRIHDDAKMQVETLLVAQIPPWTAQYQLALKMPSTASTDIDALMDLATDADSGARLRDHEVETDPRAGPQTSRLGQSTDGEVHRR
jgi:hypothetical protein